MFDPLCFPTPVQELHLDEAAELGCHLYIKRDDLLPYAFGGNKVRIAAEFVADLRMRGCNALIMYGDVRSNLCRVLAMLCHEESIPCLMIATSAGDAADAAPSFNEELVRSYGVEILLCETGKIAERVDDAFSIFRERGLKPYYIYGDRTGRGNEGVAARAYAKAYEELCSWEHAHGLTFDMVITPYGTGCTQAGLICGSMSAGDEREIVGISISSRPRTRALAILEDAVREWFVLEGRSLPADYMRHIHLETNYTCGGYGVRNARVTDLIGEVLRDTTVPLDPTYTGKALRGAIDYLKDRGLHDRNVLFLHTGGLTLFFDYLGERREANERAMGR